MGESGPDPKSWNTWSSAAFLSGRGLSDFQKLLKLEWLPVAWIDRIYFQAFQFFEAGVGRIQVIHERIERGLFQV